MFHMTVRRELRLIFDNEIIGGAALHHYLHRTTIEYDSTNYQHPRIIPSREFYESTSYSFFVASQTTYREVICKPGMYNASKNYAHDYTINSAQTWVH